MYQMSPTASYSFVSVFSLCDNGQTGLFTIESVVEREERLLVLEKVSVEYTL